MKILSYNLYNGADRSYDDLVTFINDEKPDILCLQEANYWQEGSPSRIEQFAQATGFKSWQFGDSNTDFKLVTFSRQPIISSECVTNGFWHSTVRVTVAWRSTQLTIWNIHLDPRTPDLRLSETERLTSIIGTPKSTIITGDFNSISRTDPYPANLIDQLHVNGIQKFGETQLSFKEMQNLLNAGFVDITAALGKTDTTVPTPSNDDNAHSIALRLDYILASLDIAPLVKIASVIKNDLTDTISDHYPVTAIVE